MKEYAKKNWKSIVFILAFALLILFNVKQYQHSLQVVAENTKINTMYLESLKREKVYNEIIANYKTEISRKDSAIKASKQEVAETEADLQVSQDEANRLAKIITGRDHTQIPDGTFVKTCDSLAVVTPILTSQVDTLKSQNKSLVKNLEDKSKLQDSIISIKDKVILDKDSVMKTAVASNNKLAKDYVKIETKLNKSKKATSTWRWIAVGLAGIVGGAFALK